MDVRLIGPRGDLADAPGIRGSRTRIAVDSRGPGPVPRGSVATSPKYCTAGALLQPRDSPSDSFRSGQTPDSCLGSGCRGFIPPSRLVEGLSAETAQELLFGCAAGARSRPGSAPRIDVLVQVEEVVRVVSA